MPLRRAADGLAFRPGILWPEMKGPGLKPYRFGHGFRGMNAPAPSKETNNGKSSRLFRREFVEELRCAGLEHVRAEGESDVGESVRHYCLQENGGVRLRVVA